MDSRAGKRYAPYAISETKMLDASYADGKAQLNLIGLFGGVSNK
jgi:hypothetical protein